MGFHGGLDINNTFVHKASYPIVTERNDVCKHRLEELSALILCAIVSDKQFETDAGELLTKPLYFFGDSIKEDDDFMLGGEERWLCVIYDIIIFLLGMSYHTGLPIFSLPLSPKQMNWSLVSTVKGVTLGKFTHSNVAAAREDRGVVHLLLSFVQRDYPQSENPWRTKMFINKYLVAGGDYPVEMRTEGWVFSTNKEW